MTTMRAFHNDPEIKAKYLRRVAEHRAAHKIVRGVGWTGDRGCAVGCTLEAYDHSRYPIELGIPEHIAHLEDIIFEGLGMTDAIAWPERFLESVPVGADLSLVWPRFAVWLLTERIPRGRMPADVVAALDGVAQLYRSRVTGVEPPHTDWRMATNTARATRVTLPTRAAGVPDAGEILRAAEIAWAAGAAETGDTTMAAEVVWTVNANANAWAARAADAAAIPLSVQSTGRAALVQYWRECADKLVELLASAESAT